MNLLKEGILNGTVIKTEQVVKLTVDGLTDNYPVYKVRLDNLYFNDQNDRIATWISQYKAENGVDSISRDDIATYNGIIHKFIQESNPERLKQTQINIELLGQQKFGVVLNDGRIIDGNRRYTCLRNLSQNSDKFSYFETVIIEKDYEHNAKQIKMLELQIQIGEDARVDYDPIDKLVGVYRDIVEEELLSTDEYRRSTNQSKADVEKQVEIAKLLVEFLEAINAPKQYYLAREMDLNGPLVELYAILKKIKDDDKRQDIKMIAFANFLVQPAGDMTRFIRKFKSVSTSKFIDEFIEKEFELTEEVLDSMPEKGKVNLDVISEVRSNKENKEVFEHTIDKYEAKAKNIEARNHNNQVIEKAAELLESVDPQVVNKFNEEELSEFWGNMKRLEEIINGIKEEVNV